MNQKLLELALEVRDSGVGYFKCCMESLNNTEMAFEVMRELAEKTNNKFYVKVGGASAAHDFDYAKQHGADGVIVPMVESVYAARCARDLAKSRGLEINIMLETSTALLNPLLWNTAKNISNTIIFGRDDIYKSGQESMDPAYRYLKDFCTLGVGGGITPKEADRITRDYFDILFIDTRNCRLNVFISNIFEAVIAILYFEAEFYRYIGDNDTAEILEKRIDA